MPEEDKSTTEKEDYNIFKKAVIKLLVFVKYAFIDSLAKFTVLLFSAVWTGLKWVIRIEPEDDKKDDKE